MGGGVTEAQRTYMERINGVLRGLTPPARYTIGGGDIHNIAAIADNPNILFQWITTVTSMAGTLPQFAGKPSQPRGDVGTAVSYLLFVSNALGANPSNDGNIAVTYDSTKREWSSGGFSVSADALLRSWETLLKGLYRYQHEAEVSIIDRNETFTRATSVSITPTALPLTQIAEYPMTAAQQPVLHWKIFGTTLLYISDDHLYIQDLVNGLVRSVQVLQNGTSMDGAATVTTAQTPEDFILSGGKIFVLYREHQEKTIPIEASGSRRGGASEQKSSTRSYKIKSVNQESGVVLEDVVVFKPTEDQGNFTQRKLFEINGKIVYATSVDDYFEIDPRSSLSAAKQKKILLSVLGTRQVNYVKDVATDGTNLGILFHQGAGAVRHVLGSDGMIYRNVDNANDWSSHLAISNRYIIVNGIGGRGDIGTARGHCPVVLRVTDLVTGVKKTFEFPYLLSDLSVQSLKVEGQDVYVFGFSEHQSTLWKVNLETGHVSESTFKNSGLEACLQQIGPDDFYISDGQQKIMHFRRVPAPEPEST